MPLVIASCCLHMSAQEIWWQLRWNFDKETLLSMAISEGSQLQSVWHVAFPWKSLQEQNYFNIVLTCALAWLRLISFEVLLPRRNTRTNLAFAYRSECRPQKSWKIRLQKDVYGIAEVQIMWIMSSLHKLLHRTLRLLKFQALKLLQQVDLLSWLQVECLLN